MKTAKEILQNTFKLIGFNIKPILLFSIFYFVIMFYIPILLDKFMLFLFKLIHGGIYLGNGNAIDILTMPAMWPGIIFSLIITAGILMFQVGAVAYAVNESKKNNKVKFSQMAIAGFKVFTKIFIPRNWLILLYAAIILPLTGAIKIGCAGIKISVPEFVEDFAYANGTLKYLYPLALLALFLLAIRWIFSIVSFSLEDKTFRKSCKESVALNKKRMLKTIGMIILGGIIFIALDIIISALFALVVTLISLLIEGNGFSAFGFRYLNSLKNMTSLIYSIFIPILNIGLLTTMFYKWREKNKVEDPIPERDIKPFKTKGKVIFIVCFIVGAVLSTFVAKEYISCYMHKSKRPIVCAHRGESYSVPENTMLAFKTAVKKKADWVEMDVHKTKDGKIIVSHDDYIERVSGKPIYVHESNYDYLRKLDVGSWFDKKYSYVRFSNLDEALKYLRSKGKHVQIETKPVDGNYPDGTPINKGFEEKVIKIIKDNHMEDRVLIISQNEDSLKRVKKIDPNIKTANCMVVAWGDIGGITWVNCCSIEEENVTPAIIDNMHKADKICFSWTVNRAENIQNLVDCGIDGIVTDNVVMVRKTLDEIDYTPGIDKFIRMVAK